MRLLDRKEAAGLDQGLNCQARTKSWAQGFLSYYGYGRGKAPAIRDLKPKESIADEATLGGYSLHPNGSLP